MKQCYCLAPAGSKDPRILILGSMPGQISIQKQQYYAHPQNSFWKIMGELFGAFPSLAYADRVKILASHHITLWESLQSCIRKGSSDSEIYEEVPNDFNSFFKTHPHVTHIFFDGQKAFNVFRRHIEPTLEKGNITLIPLPSTSPRHATINFTQKLEAWRQVALATTNPCVSPNSCYGL